MLALWEYFWEETDWTGTPAPAPAPTQEESRGGGHKKENDYLGLPPDFWLVRERYLRRFVEPLEKDITPAQPITNVSLELPVESDTLAGVPPGGVAVILLEQAFAAAANRARQAQTAAELQDATLRARALALDISKIKQQYYNRAISLLLLDAF